jgi:Flp pilus assembly protein TadG
VDERGGGPISLWIGFSVFLVMLLFAVQVLFNLYAASVVTAVSYDAARRVAGSDGGSAYTAEAEDQARQALGRYASRVTFDWSGSTADEVVLHVQSDNPSVLLPVLAGPAAFDRLDRTIRVRVERFR